MVFSDDQLLTPEEASELLGMSPRTMKKWRTEGGNQGPQFVRVSHRCVRYKVSVLRSWQDARLRSSTAHVEQMNEPISRDERENLRKLRTVETTENGSTCRTVLIQEGEIKPVTIPALPRINGKIGELMKIK